MFFELCFLIFAVCIFAKPLNMTDGFWSDYLTLEVAMSSLLKGHESVYTRIEVPPGEVMYPRISSPVKFFGYTDNLAQALDRYFLANGIVS